MSKKGRIEYLRNRIVQKCDKYAPDLDMIRLEAMRCYDEEQLLELNDTYLIEQFLHLSLIHI